MTQQTQQGSSSSTASAPDLYFVSTQYSSPTYLRRVGLKDEVLDVNGKWRPTQQINDWMIGENSYLDQLTKAEFDRRTAGLVS